MLYYKGFGIQFDKLAKDYEIKISDSVKITERFMSLTDVFNFIDTLFLDKSSR